MNIKKDWGKDFFSGLWLEFQPEIKPDETTIKEADFLVKALNLRDGARVLDVPCGLGRLSIELAKRGYNLTGVDKTHRFIETAKEKARKGKIRIDFYEKDMRDLPFDCNFDAVFCFWGSFGYFDEKGDIDFLEAVNRVLKPGGKFLLDIVVAESILPRFMAKDWMKSGDMIIINNREWNHETSCVDEEWTLIKGEKREVKYSAVRIYTYREMVKLLESTGFGKCTGYSNLVMDPFKLKSPRLLLVTEKEA